MPATTIKRIIRIGSMLLIACVSVYVIASKIVVDKVSSLSDLCTAQDAKTGNTPNRFFLYNMHNQVEPFNTKPYWYDHTNAVRFPSLQPSTTLSAWVRKNSSDQWVILVHGHSNCKKDTHILSVSGMLVKHGYSVLLLDLREHGESTRYEHKHTAGHYEADDVIAAWKWLQENQGANAKNIGIYGTSFGSGAASIAFMREPTIRAVWLDAPYADMDKILKGELNHQGLPTSLSQLAHHGCKIFQGIDIAEVSPLKSMQTINDRHVAISYYQNDTRTPAMHGELLCDAAQRHANTQDKVTCHKINQGLTFSNGLVEHHGVGPFVDAGWEHKVHSFFKHALRT